MTYEESLAYIASLEPRGWRLGTERMRAFCSAAGLNDSLGTGRSPKFIHVAGTNGKGSTTAYLQSLMVESGFRTGAFFSPFVVDPRERVQFDRDLIGREDLARLTTNLLAPAESLEGTTFEGVTEFEFKTAIGFAYWKEKCCDWVALEVGLGGRFDATNVVTPCASIIVSIGMDHMSILGGTLAAIAYEKAGIIKNDVPVIVGDLPTDAMRVVETFALDHRSEVWKWGRDIRWEPNRLDPNVGTVFTPQSKFTDVKTGMVGVTQGHNVSLAIAAMQAAGISINEEVVGEGARLATAPGRFQQREIDGQAWIFDGAHNPDSARMLRKTLETIFPNRRIILVSNMVRGHEPSDFYREILEIVDSVHVPPIDYHRAFSPDETAYAINKLGAEAIAHESISTAIRAAGRDAYRSEFEPPSLIVVTGSFYLVGEMLRHFA